MTSSTTTFLLPSIEVGVVVICGFFHQIEAALEVPSTKSRRHIQRSLHHWRFLSPNRGGISNAPSTIGGSFHQIEAVYPTLPPPLEVPSTKSRRHIQRPLYHWRFLPSVFLFSVLKCYISSYFSTKFLELTIVIFDM